MSVVNSIIRAVLFGITADVLIKCGLISTRYFRRNKGSTDYATIPDVTLAGDFVIEGSFLTSNSGSAGTFVGGTTISTAEVLLDILTDGKVRFVVYSSSGSFAGLIQSAVGFNDGRLHTFKATMNGKSAELFVDGVSVGTGNYSSYDFVNTSRLCVRSNNTNPFNGILANLKIYDNGTLVRDYPINDNSNTIRDLANGQDGTIINGNADDWGLFDKQANGDWLGQELASTRDVSFTLGAAYEWGDLSTPSTIVQTGRRYSIEYKVAETPSGESGIRNRSFDDVEPYIYPISSYSRQGAAARDTANIQGNMAGAYLLNEVSVKEVLKSA